MILDYNNRDRVQTVNDSRAQSQVVVSSSVLRLVHFSDTTQSRHLPRSPSVSQPVTLGYERKCPTLSLTLPSLISTEESLCTTTLPRLLSFPGPRYYPSSPHCSNPLGLGEWVRTKGRGTDHGTKVTPVVGHRWKRSR